MRLWRKLSCSKVVFDLASRAYHPMLTCTLACYTIGMLLQLAGQKIPIDRTKTTKDTTIMCMHFWLDLSRLDSTLFLQICYKSFFVLQCSFYPLFWVRYVVSITHSPKSRLSRHHDSYHDRRLPLHQQRWNPPLLTSTRRATTTLLLLLWWIVIRSIIF